MNRQDSIFNRPSRRPLRSNTVNPDILIGPIWLHNNEPSGVEIIELNSSNEELSPRDPNCESRRHAWSYVRKERMENIQDSYNINKLAREKRRSQYTSENRNNDTENNFHENHLNTHIDDDIDIRQQMNCFGVINKQFLESDTTTDCEYGDVEVITSDIIMGGSNNWSQEDSNFFNEEIITCDADLNQETRTVWIYSFKNKHLLAENQFEVPPYKEHSSSSYSTDSSGEQTKEPYCRIGSPTAVPKLDLSLVPTLSTVVEISECNLDRSSTKSVQSTTKINQTLGPKHKAKYMSKHEKSTSVINWLSLSPRERRRVLKENTLSDTWVGPCLRFSDFNVEGNISRVEDRGDQAKDHVEQDAVEVEIKVEVHKDDNGATKDSAKSAKNSATCAFKTITSDISSINKIKYADAFNEERFQKDRGDHGIKLVAPVIRLTPKSRRSHITDPLEKLDTSDWIHENETNVYDYVLERSESLMGVEDTANVVDHLWLKNTIPFLKPPHWSKFRPIADSPVSYHISIGSIEERKTWYQRVLDFLKCCK